MSWIELVAQRRPPQAPAGMQPPENAKDWFRIENSVTDEDSTDVYVYNSIGGWFGMYADEFIEQLGAVTTSKISLRLNSPGGSVFEGIAIANAIRNHPANVTVYVDSLAASIASVIAMSGDRLVMMPQSQIMVHNASGACYGDATEMTKMADLLDKQTRNIAEAYAQYTGGTVAEWQQYMADETWFTAEEAVAAGLADEVVPMRPKKGEEAEDPACVSAQMSRSWDLSMYRYPGRTYAPAPAMKAPTTPFATGGLVPSGIQITADLLNGIRKPENGDEAEQVVKVGSPEFENYVLEMIRKEIRAELAVIEGTACPSHSTAVKDGTWDAGANEGHLPSPVPLATVKKMYAYYDEDKVEDGAVPKSAAKLPHHFVSADGTPGAASINGVRNALARLPQTQGLSDAERSAAEAHLRKHLSAFENAAEDEDPEDAKKELPPFLQPDKEEDEDEETEDGAEKDAVDNSDSTESDDGNPRAEHPVDTGLGNSEETVESIETYDEWNSLGLFNESPSPSADDVFKSLKEAW